MATMVKRYPGGVSAKPVTRDIDGYTWRRDPRREDRFTVTSPDGSFSYTVCTGNGFDTCSCPAYRRDRTCPHIVAVQSGLQQDPFADQGGPDHAVRDESEAPGSVAPTHETIDHQTLALRYACETALNALYRMRITDMNWKRHPDMRDEVDGAVLPALRDALSRVRSPH